MSSFESYGSSACVIRGGRPVRGEVTCLGAKNFATKAMVAATLGDSPTTLWNVPVIGDTAITAEMLTSVGVRLQTEGTTMVIDPSHIVGSLVPKPDSGSNRIPILLLAALLHRFPTVVVPTLGGCNIGARPVDFHTMAMRAFGATVEDDGHVLTASRKGPLKAAHIDLPYPSVGATETCLMLAVLAQGRSVITNVATEPEIMALIAMLNLMGAVILPGPNRELRIDGVKALTGARMPILGDRIETASLACLACASNGDIIVNGIRPETLINFMPHYQRVGGGVELVGPEAIRFFRRSALRTSVLETDVFPGFSTDWQQPFAILLTQAEGISLIHETVYENRFGYLAALNKLGAKTQLTTQCLGGTPCRFRDKDHPHSAIIVGATHLVGDHTIDIPDLRAGLAYVVAASMCDGQTTLRNLEYLERGYGDIVTRLAHLNLDIMEVKRDTPKAKKPVGAESVGAGV